MEVPPRKDNFRLDSEDFRYEKTENSETQLLYLKSEIDYLRNELNHTMKQNTNSLIDLKYRQEQQLSMLHANKEGDLQEEFATILTLQRVLSKESDKCSSLRQTILNFKLDHSEKIAEMNEDLERLAKDAEYLRNKAIRSCNNEVLEYQHQIEVKRMKHSKNLKESKTNNSGELYQIEGVLKDEDKKIKLSESELQEIRKKSIEKLNFDDTEIEKVKSTLRSTQRIAEKQEHYLKLLRDERESARKESRDGQKSLSIIKHRVSCLSSESKELNLQLQRLENLTYEN